MKRFFYQQFKRGMLPHLLHFLRLDRVFLTVLNLIYKNNYIRVVSYHDVPNKFVKRFEDHIKFYSENFVPVTLDILDCFLRSGEWHSNRPGIMLSFDDGLRSWKRNVIPILEQYGFTGWFLVPTEFITVPVDQQWSYAKDHRIVTKQHFDDGRYALSQEDLRLLAQKHIVVCHTKTHRRLGSELVNSEIEQEIISSKSELEQIIGQTIDVFGWVGGEISSYSSSAFDAIRQAGYRYSLLTKSAPVTCKTDPYQIHRTVVGIEIPTRLLRYQVCGLIDISSILHRTAIRRLAGTHHAVSK